MKSRVYFIGVSNSDNVETVVSKLGRLLDESKVLDFIGKDYRVAIKMHFGEEGNTGYVRPTYLRLVCERICQKSAIPILADTNTLYRGKRTNLQDHLKLAQEHGFTKATVGADVLVIDDTKKENITGVIINQKFIKTAKICRFFLDADAIVDISHFKGHIMTGFGGALKNIGMGCATREGKLAQHSDISPVVILSRCVGCGACEKACPVKAISIKNKKSRIDNAKCIGCATCIAVCPKSAIDVDWEPGGGSIQEKMVEYASAVLKDRKDRVAFLNFAVKITAECDCLAKDDPVIAPDIGIFASGNPVAIDKACYDLINKTCGKDVLREAHPNRDGFKQLRYASELGIGNLEYDLIPLR